VASIFRATLLTKALRIEPSLLRGNCAASAPFTCSWSSISRPAAITLKSRRLYALSQVTGKYLTPKPVSMGLPIRYPCCNWMVDDSLRLSSFGRSYIGPHGGLGRTVSRQSRDPGDGTNHRDRCEDLAASWAQAIPVHLAAEPERAGAHIRRRPVAGHHRKSARRP